MSANKKLSTFTLKRQATKAKGASSTLRLQKYKQLLDIWKEIDSMRESRN